MLNLIKKYQLEITAALLFIAVIVIFAWQAIAVEMDVKTPPHFYRVGYAVVFDAAAADSTSAAWDITPYDNMTFAVTIAAGTATIKPQVTQDEINWYDVAEVTESSYLNVQGCFKKARVKIDDCSSCQIDVTWMGNNR